ncbi:MAG: hypothetical protein NWF01_05645 [Candidatus Bathyarchaeota archaeon]|nr:hypothetical protein [Candidatus Bathyarchaeota archaeon]
MSCDDPNEVERRKLLEIVNKKFKLYIVLAIVYGVVFINYIDLVFGGSSGYHLWLIPMYFFPFFALSALSFKRNIRLTLALGLIASLMNDIFYGPVGYLFGSTRIPDLGLYFTHWFIPSNTFLFSLNLGFTVVDVYSWMMSLTIYARIFLIFVLIRAWKIRADEKCVDGQLVRKKTRSKFWDDLIDKY